MKYKTIVEDDIDILVCGAGLGGTGADQLLYGYAIRRK